MMFHEKYLVIIVYRSDYWFIPRAFNDCINYGGFVDGRVIMNVGKAIV
jgi:hypothetical protein